MKAERLGACEPSAARAPNPHRVSTQGIKPDQTANFSEIASDG
jgi:hypothetical protein